MCSARGRAPLGARDCAPQSCVSFHPSRSTLRNGLGNKTTRTLVQERAAVVKKVYVSPSELHSRGEDNTLGSLLEFHPDFWCQYSAVQERSRPAGPEFSFLSAGNLWQEVEGGLGMFCPLCAGSIDMSRTVFFMVARHVGGRTAYFLVARRF